jgi:hypothetical protein
MTSHFQKSPFDTLEEVFATLCADPRPLALEAGLVAHLPRRAIPLDELRGILLHPSTAHGTRDAAIRVLLARARTEGGRWTIGLGGVLLPGLRRATRVFRDMCPGKAADIEAEALVGLIEGIAATEPTRRRLASRLVWLARNRAKRLVADELLEVGRVDHSGVPDAPTRPYGHPDLVLAKAVLEGVLCAGDAALIGETRLGLLSVAEAARRLGIEAKAAYKRRDRAEAALVAWMNGSDYEPGFVEKEGSLPYSDAGGRPRAGRSTDRPSAACQPLPDQRR